MGRAGLKPGAFVALAALLFPFLTRLFQAVRRLELAVRIRMGLDSRCLKHDKFSQTSLWDYFDSILTILKFLSLESLCGHLKATPQNRISEQIADLQSLPGNN